MSSNGPVCDTARTSTCDALGCDPTRLVVRQRHIEIVNGIKNWFPVIHFGAYASGDTVMKSGEHRDQIAEREQVIAFEMEGAGIWEIFPCIVIKGVCDYADSHKNKQWQNYAAATAAACLKAFLEVWPASQPDTSS
ncbi:nucleoside phosphorylase domain-containing protein [Xylaria bambusicola]|uniref:nucleoside phosphorylase domain-containing protein n=1 Tax=Xylaria bambusicola TaxID=326684 RepID=UPI002007C80B|nr:nucleoside phosphorylase domain-containing protein [Xylaria bambusicola]KAI0506427.1 nucleoside phosphorylase domain-containing protein [Xylaria bambusicola]